MATSPVQATGDLTRGFSNASTKNREAMLEEVGHNIELQTLVFCWIRDYKRQAAASGGRSVAELVENKHQAYKTVATHGAEEQETKSVVKSIRSPLRVIPGTWSSLKT